MRYNTYWSIFKTLKKSFSSFKIKELSEKRQITKEIIAKFYDVIKTKTGKKRYKKKDFVLNIIKEKRFFVKLKMEEKLNKKIDNYAKKENDYIIADIEKKFMEAISNSDVPIPENIIEKYIKTNISEDTGDMIELVVSAEYDARINHEVDFELIVRYDKITQDYDIKAIRCRGRDWVEGKKQLELI